MPIAKNRVRQYLSSFAFVDLFIEELGWDLHNEAHNVLVEGQYHSLQSIAQKRGMVAFTYDGIPDNKLRRKIERQLARSIHEHIIIYTDTNEQVWQWVRREPGKPLANRELRYILGTKEEAVIQALDAIAFSFEEEDNLSIVDVTSRVRAAFDVERVTRRFYDFFKQEHDAFLKFIEGIPDAEMERWYVSVMLNRLMFIYFVQKKGFLDNNADYLRDKLAEARGNFYRDFLIPLFFEGFALREAERSPAIRRLLGNVPYLNGGLFLPHYIEELHGNTIQIDNEAFARLFDFFDRYQWHLDERPLRRDTEINPDVLGYIFEKYINQKQMGAYYTKEDITEYISQNTIIPFLFDETRKNCRVAFEGKGNVWELLQADPDRYIYGAVKHGIEYDLPEYIEVGLNDISQRGQWNTPAPLEIALPTEIWRETVARRQRYEEVRAKLANGEVQSINDLITLNLNIRQFAQDVIENAESSDLLKAFWNSINGVTVLDPTCGSGAFLFAALNILEPLYEACLDRMQVFIDELEREEEHPHPQKYKLFREVLQRIEQHPNRKYFIYKSIIVNNLYGVDIMEEAIEICKLRLFLKLVAQVERPENIEPLPDIDFNIRAGNTLVGFTSLEGLKQAITNPSGNAPKLLLLPEDEHALKVIEEQAQDIHRLFDLFREQQTTLGGTITAEDKRALQDRLRELEAELNQHLARQYGVDPANAGTYTQWQVSHKPFHWFIDFYGIMADGGFDVIIGNPPYVELNVLRDYQLIGYTCISAGNLYALVIERCFFLGNSLGRQGFIVPVSSISTSRYRDLQKLLTTRYVHYSSFDDRPSRLFDGLQHIRLTIHLIGPSDSDNVQSLFSTRYNKWSAVERSFLFQSLEYVSTNGNLIEGSLPKLSSGLEISIARKMFGQKPLSSYYVRTSSHKIFYSRKVGYFLQVLDFEPIVLDGDGNRRPPSEFKELRFPHRGYSRAALCLLNANLFYWFVTVFSDCRHVNKREVDAIPINLEEITAEITYAQVENLASELMNNLQATSIINQMQFQHDTLKIQFIYPKYSKPIIDEIDHVLAKHYGFTDEELDFIINYDIKYRMGDDLGGDDGDGEE